MRALRPSLWVVLAALALPATAEDPAQIADLTVKVDGNQVLVSFHLDNAFDQRFVERVQSGLPTGFPYRSSCSRTASAGTTGRSRTPPCR